MLRELTPSSTDRPAALSPLTSGGQHCPSHCSLSGRPLRVKVPFSVLCVICGLFSRPGRELSITMSRTLRTTPAPRVLEDTRDPELPSIRTPGETGEALTPAAGLGRAGGRGLGGRGQGKPLPRWDPEQRRKEAADGPQRAALAGRSERGEWLSLPCAPPPVGPVTFELEARASGMALGFSILSPGVYLSFRPWLRLSRGYFGPASGYRATGWPAGIAVGVSAPSRTSPAGRGGLGRPMGGQRRPSRFLLEFPLPWVTGALTED